MLTVLDLFSGIGGFSLGLERTGGFETVAFCEIEPFQRAVLAKHWPGVTCYEDVCALTAERIATDGHIPDVICGGFPCQDISIAGKGTGLSGHRSGLWFEYARLIEEVAPEYAIIENVPALRTRGLDVVLGSISEIGYDAEWHCIPAAAIGAAHQRDRVWIIAYPNSDGRRRKQQKRRSDQRDTHAGRHGASRYSCGPAIVADNSIRGRREHGNVCIQAFDEGAGQLAYGSSALPNRHRTPVLTAADIERVAAQRIWGRTQPGLDRKAHGVPRFLDGIRPVEPWEGNTPRTIPKGAPNRRRRLKAIGNSVVPQIPELIGRAILAAEAMKEAA